MVMMVRQAPLGQRDQQVPQVLRVALVQLG
jgi:hypothetical protein